MRYFKKQSSLNWSFEEIENAENELKRINPKYGVKDLEEYLYKKYNKDKTSSKKIK